MTEVERRQRWRDSPKGKAYNKRYAYEYGRKRMQTIRDLIIHIKSTTPCADCRLLYGYWVMDFDHVGGDKKFNLARATSRKSLLKAKLEIAKCEVVCANCHREREHRRKLES